MMKIQPLFDRVLVLEEKQKKNGSIIIPTSAQEQPIIAKVIEVGTGGIIEGNEYKMTLKVGDKVMYHKFSGSEFDYEGTKYTLVKEIDILCRFEKE